MAIIKFFILSNLFITSLNNFKYYFQNFSLKMEISYCFYNHHLINYLLKINHHKINFKFFNQILIF